MKKIFRKNPSNQMLRCRYLLLAFLTFSLFGGMSSCNNENSLPDPLKAGWKNEAVCEVVEDNDKLRVLRCTFAPGVGHERHYHSAHFGYAIQGGKFRITDATGTHDVDVPTGTEFYNDGIEWHEVLNIGDSTAVFLLMEPKTN